MSLIQYGEHGYTAYSTDSVNNESYSAKNNPLSMYLMTFLILHDTDFTFAVVFET